MTKFQFPYEILKLKDEPLKEGEINYARFIQDNFDTIERYLNKKVLGEEWTDWTPTYDALSPMTYTSVTTNRARYCVIDNVVFFFISANGTTGGTASKYLKFYLPVKSKKGTGGGCYINDISFISGYWANLEDSTEARVYRYDGGNWGLGADKVMVVQGFYELQ